MIFTILPLLNFRLRVHRMALKCERKAHETFSAGFPKTPFDLGAKIAFEHVIYGGDKGQIRLFWERIIVP